MLFYAIIALDIDVKIPYIELSDSFLESFIMKLSRLKVKVLSLTFCLDKLDFAV